MVLVIDSIMGSCKTTNMIRYMGENPTTRFLYVSPFITEVGDGNTGVGGRLQEELPELFPISSMPRNVGEGKCEGLKYLLRKGGNIATTHALFKMFDEEVVNLVLEQGYVLIIDEAVDCVQMWDKLTKKDVTALIESEWVFIEEETDRVVWNESKNPEFDGRYSDVRTMANSGCLYLFDDRVFVLEYPPVLLSSVEHVYIMTYLFEGSLMASWMKANGIHYEYADKSLLDLKDVKEIKQTIKENLTVLSSRKIDNKYNKENDIQYRYSATWYGGKSTVAEKREVKLALESCVTHHKSKEGGVFWTTFKDQRHKLEGKGYKKGYIDPETGDVLDSFLPYNVKAINEYREFDLVLHTVNLFRSPVEKRYFASKGVEFNEDLWALSELLQFVWRARIRQGKPTKVLVISMRMRNLLIKWLNEEDV